MRLGLSSVRFPDIVAGMFRTQYLHVREIVRLLAPGRLKTELPITDAVSAMVVQSRETVTRILQQQDPRLLVVVGPCSIHDVDAALEYGTRLNTLRAEMADQME